MVSTWLTEPNAIEDEKTILAIGKAIQEAIEASTDILSMLLKDESQPPLDDHSNIDRAINLGIFSKKIGNAMHEANGLRNRLVHGYNGINTSLMFESIKRLIPLIHECLGMMEQWLNLKSKV